MLALCILTTGLAVATPYHDAKAQQGAAPAPGGAKATSQNATPSALRLYTDGYAASYLPVPGFKPVEMPVRDASEGAPSCYIACATHDKRGSLYAPDANTFVVGAVRVMGNYQDGQCRPGGIERGDLAADSRLSELCGVAIPAVCEGKRCFASGDTGHWVPPAQSFTTPTNTAIRQGEATQSCVLACYSHSREDALYEVSADTFAVGGFQTAGRYVNDICKPQTSDNNDDAFKRRCTELFPKQCANDTCWVNGDTRGRLGSS